MIAALWFIAGLWIGTALGIVAMAIAVAGRIDTPPRADQ